MTVPTGDPHRDPANLIVLCADCHASIDRYALRGFEFETALADLMQASGKYRDIQTEAALPLGRGAPRRADILAKSEDGGETILIECKETPTIGDVRLLEALRQLKSYEALAGGARLVLALPARLNAQQKNAALLEGIEVWDLDEIAARFREGLDRVNHPLLRSLLHAAAALNRTSAETPESRLLYKLRELEPGRGAWSAYQKLVSRIFEHLFCPPLSTPIVNLADDADVNRRDIILPNYAEAGFWAFVRGRYAADFIVVDAKNYTEEIGKSDALQILNYLKRHGAGQLGIIVTRKGANAACMAVIREHWAHFEKMLIILSDDHIERMLRVKEACGPAEDVIRQWVEEFRLSM